MASLAWRTQPRSVEELDELMRFDAIPVAVTRWFTPLQHTLLLASPTLVRLLYIKHLYAHHPTTEERFCRIRSTRWPSGNADGHLQKYSDAFHSLNKATNNPFGPNKVARFLDLGCSPGGFSSWLLRNNPDATGVGVTLLDETASWPMKTAATLLGSGRYKLHFADVSQLAMNADSAIIDTKTFDLILGCVFPTNLHIQPLQRIHLLLSQVLIMLVNIEQGGNAVILVNSKMMPWIMEVVAILRRCFRNVQAGKGNCMHKERSSCYLVCTYFSTISKEKTNFVDRLQAALDGIQKATEQQVVGSQYENNHPELQGDRRSDASASGRPLDGSFRLLGLTYEDFIREEGKHFLELFEPVWQAQYDSIYALYCNGIRKLGRGRSNKNANSRKQTGGVLTQTDALLSQMVQLVMV